MVVAAGAGDRDSEARHHVDDRHHHQDEEHRAGRRRPTSRNSTRKITNTTTESMCSITELRPVLVDFQHLEEQADEADHEDQVAGGQRPRHARDHRNGQQLLAPAGRVAAHEQKGKEVVGDQRDQQQRGNEGAVARSARRPGG